MSMSLDLAVRSLKAVAAFDPDANLGDLRRVIHELRDALTQLEETIE